MTTGNGLSPSVLVVDDDLDLLLLIHFKLKAAGFRAMTSLNGEKVWEIISQTRPDIVLLDIQMKGIFGNDICKKIKANPLTAGIPVLLFSANDNIDIITKECGADGFITKPLKDEYFRNTLQQYLAVG